MRPSDQQLLLVRGYNVNLPVSKLWLALVVLPVACTFNFEVTSQRTALENQVMGSYRELEDDLVLVSSVRGPSNAEDKLAPSKKLALDARQNQEFNRDDVDELKDKGVLGEASDGRLQMLPADVAKTGKVDAAVRQLAERLVAEENRDRAAIWQRIVAGNANLSDKDLPEVQRTYAKMQRESAAPGHWYQNDNGQWLQKPAASGND